MASNVPVVKQIAWASMLPQLGIMLLVGLACHLCGAAEPLLPAVLIYLTLSFILRNVVASDHRKGMQIVRKSEFSAAIPYFEKSYAFFTNHSWVDKYRYVTLLSSSRMCYREMALCNIAFCFTQIGEGEKAIDVYRQALQMYPENGLAQAALNMMTSTQK